MACKKVNYPSEYIAQEAAKNARRKGIYRNHYECPHCDQWHLTSMSKKVFRAATRKARENAGLKYGGIESLRE